MNFSPTPEQHEIRESMRRFAQPFDALIDHGHLHRLGANERSAYATNIAAAARPGARFLLVVPVKKTAGQKLVDNVKRLFQASFDLIYARTVIMPHPDKGTHIQGAAFRFVRR